MAKNNGSNGSTLSGTALVEFIEGQIKAASEKTKSQGKNNKIKEQALAALAALGGDTVGTDDVLFGGTKFIIPETMSVKDAIRFLQRKEEADRETTEFSQIYKYRPLDGAWCFINAVKKHFGAMNQIPTPSFFGQDPPRLVSVEVAPGKEEQVPWGRVQIPHLPEVTFELGATRDRDLGPVFVLGAFGPNRFRAHVQGVFNLVAEELAENSLYRGKAIDGAQERPGFLDLAKIDDRVVYSTDVMTQLDVNVWSPIRDADAHAAAGLATKRAVLFEGPYGTGKSLAGMLTGRVAVAAGWTYILCRPGKDDPYDVMTTAKLYQPAAIVIEDVDSFGSTEANDTSTDVAKLLDAFDGIAAKGAKMVMVLTANHPERIHKGMLRPGRLDAVIHVGELDPTSIKRLVEVVVGDRLGQLSDTEWEAFFKSVEGYMPAFVREAAERSVRYAIAQHSDKVDGKALVDAANGLRPQLELMEGASERNSQPTLDAAFKEMLGGSFEDEMLEAANRVVDGSVLLDNQGGQMARIVTKY